ncbi:MAG: class I SAM-dependent methyltransferase [Gaiellaceae bacterium]
MALERPALVEAVALGASRRSDRVLDVGTGTAGVFELLAKVAEPPEVAVGVDSSPEMLAHAPPLPQRWQLVHADARELPFEQESFDLVTMAYLLHLVRPVDRRALLAEAARVLAPGGRIVVVTPAAPRSRLGRALLAPLAWAANRSSGLLAGFRQLDPRADLEAAGFEVSAARYVDRGYRSCCVRAEPGHQNAP